jgi:hypothetical protein
MQGVSNSQLNAGRCFESGKYRQGNMKLGPPIPLSVLLPKERIQHIRSVGRSY